MRFVFFLRFYRETLEQGIGSRAEKADVDLILLSVFWDLYHSPSRPVLHFNWGRLISWVHRVVLLLILSYLLTPVAQDSFVTMNEKTSFHHCLLTKKFCSTPSLSLETETDLKLNVHVLWLRKKLQIYHWETNMWDKMSLDDSYIIPWVKCI